MLSSYSPAATAAVKTLSETWVLGGGSSLERRGLRCERAVHTADLRNCSETAFLSVSYWLSHTVLLRRNSRSGYSARGN